MNGQLISISSGKFQIYMNLPSGKPQLFCIHGGLGLSSDSLMPSLDILSEQFDLIFMDQRGHGNSDSPKDENYWFENFAKDIQEVLGQLPTASMRGVFGHSMGGMIAIQTLSEFPELFQFAILSNTALDAAWMKDASQAVTKIDQDELRTIESKYEKAPNDKTLKDLGIIYGPIYFPELSTEKAKHEMWKLSYRNDSLAFMNKNVFSNMNLRSKAETIKIPTLIVSGELDCIVPLHCQNELMSHLSNGTHVIVGGAGHFPFITKQNDFKKFVSDFWDKVRGKK